MTPNRIFLTGATGVLGRSLVPRLVERGDEVTGVARTGAKAADLAAVGARPVSVDLFDPGAVKAATAGHDAILHLATNVPPLSRAARKSGWDVHNRLRTEATVNLTAAARAHGIERFVKESVTFVYPDRGAEWIDERTAPDPRLTLLAPTLEGERLALDLASADHQVAVLRFGLFYGGIANRGTDDARRLARWRMSMIAGRADAYMSSIHVDDVAASVIAALGVPTGLYNVVDDEPLPRGEYVRVQAAALGVKPPRLMPGWLLRAVGGGSAAALLASQRVSNRAFREAAGWSPEYPSAREGWAAVARADREHRRA
jgi:nucleoside-diphosphate-sugar epimerase